MAAQPANIQFPMALFGLPGAPQYPAGLANRTIQIRRTVTGAEKTSLIQPLAINGAIEVPQMFQNDWPDSGSIRSLLINDFGPFEAWDTDRWALVLCRLYTLKPNRMVYTFLYEDEEPTLDLGGRWYDANRVRHNTRLWLFWSDQYPNGERIKLRIRDLTKDWQINPWVFDFNKIRRHFYDQSKEDLYIRSPTQKAPVCPGFRANDDSAWATELSKQLQWEEEPLCFVFPRRPPTNNGVQTDPEYWRREIIDESEEPVLDTSKSDDTERKPEYPDHFIEKVLEMLGTLRFPRNTHPSVIKEKQAHVDEILKSMENMTIIDQMSSSQWDADQWDFTAVKALNVRLMDDQQRRGISMGENKELNTELVQDMFNTVLDRGENKQFSRKEWRECCEFFDYKDEDLARNNKVRIKGMTTELYPWQLFGIYWMLWRERRSRGGFMCDEADLERRVQMLGLFVVSRTLRHAWAKVDADRDKKGGPTIHLAAGNPYFPQDENAVCPRDHFYGRKCFGIPCPCVDRSISARLGRGYAGPTLVLTPFDTDIGDWVNDFEKHVDPKRFRIAIVGDDPCGYLKDRHQYPGDDNILGQTPNGQPTDDDGHPWDGEERLLIISTPNSFERNFKQDIGKDLDKITWARVIQDEFHHQKTPCSKAVNIIKNLKGFPSSRPWLPQSPAIWAVSGTPYDSPGDLKAYIDLMAADDEEMAWLESLGLRYALNGGHHERSYQEWLATGSEHEKGELLSVLLQFQGALRELMIRRNILSPTPTRWIDDNPLLDNCFTGTHITFKCQPSPKYENALTRLRQVAHKKVREATSLDAEAMAIRNLRLAATIPALAELIPQEKLEVTEDEIKKWIVEGKLSADSPYIRYLPEMIASSDKFRKIEGLIQRSEMEPDERKIVIFSSFLAICLIMQLWLSSTRSKENMRWQTGHNGRPELRKVLYIHAATKDKLALLDAFEGRQVYQETDATKYASDATILISNERVLPAGFTFTTSQLLILVEPTLTNREEELSKARIKGPRQYSALYYSFVNKDSAVERQIRTRRKQPRRYIVMSFKNKNDDAADFGPPEDEVDDNGQCHGAIVNSDMESLVDDPEAKSRFLFNLDDYHTIYKDQRPKMRETVRRDYNNELQKMLMWYKSIDIKYLALSGNPIVDLGDLTLSEPSTSDSLDVDYIEPEPPKDAAARLTDLHQAMQNASMHTCNKFLIAANFSVKDAKRTMRDAGFEETDPSRHKRTRRER